MLHAAIAVLLILLQRVVLHSPPPPPPLSFLLRLAIMAGRTLFAYELVLLLQRGRDLPAIFLRLGSAAVLSELLSRLLNDRLHPLAVAAADDMFSFVAAFALIVGIQLLTRSMPDMLMMLRPAPAGCRDNTCPPLFELRVNLGGITMPVWQGVLLGCGCILAALTAVYLLQPLDSFQTLALTAVLDGVTARLGPWRSERNRQIRRSWRLQMLAVLALFSLLLVLIDIACGIRSPLRLLSRMGTLLAVPVLTLLPRRAPEAGPRYPVRLWVPLYVLLRLLGMLFLCV
ncbi:MAG: hypothetical protein QM270_06150 [Bacillota bacterium]|nr:hypothetical protein [Bacillota bacterium]